MSMRRSVGSGVSSSGAAVSKLTAEREMEGFVAGMHASKRLNTVKRNHSPIVALAVGLRTAVPTPQMTCMADDSISIVSDGK